MKTGTVGIIIFNDSGELESKVFHGDELTSPEQQAILFLRDHEGDPLDE